MKLIKDGVTYLFNCPHCGEYSDIVERARAVEILTYSDLAFDQNGDKLLPASSSHAMTEIGDENGPLFCSCCGEEFKGQTLESIAGNEGFWIKEVKRDRLINKLVSEQEFFVEEDDPAIIKEVVRVAVQCGAVNKVTGNPGNILVIVNTGAEYEVRSQAPDPMDIGLQYDPYSDYFFYPDQDERPKCPKCRMFKDFRCTAAAEEVDDVYCEQMLAESEKCITDCCKYWNNGCCKEDNGCCKDISGDCEHLEESEPMEVTIPETLYKSAPSIPESREIVFPEDTDCAVTGHSLVHMVRFDNGGSVWGDMVCQKCGKIYSWQYDYERSNCGTHEPRPF